MPFQKASYSWGQSAELRAQTATVMGRMQALKESVEQVAERLEALAPQNAQA